MKMKSTTPKEKALLFFMQESGGVIHSHSKLPHEYRHIKMGVMTSLVKKKLVSIDEGFFTITAEGIELLKIIKKPMPPLDMGTLLKSLEEIISCAENPERVEGVALSLIKTYIDRNYDR